MDLRTRSRCLAWYYCNAVICTTNVLVRSLLPKTVKRWKMQNVNCFGWCAKATFRYTYYTASRCRPETELSTPTQVLWRGPAGACPNWSINFSKLWEMERSGPCKSKEYVVKPISTTVFKSFRFWIRFRLTFWQHPHLEPFQLCLYFLRGEPWQASMKRLRELTSALLDMPHYLVPHLDFPSTQKRIEFFVTYTLGL